MSLLLPLLTAFNEMGLQSINKLITNYIQPSDTAASSDGVFILIFFSVLLYNSSIQWINTIIKVNVENGISSMENWKLEMENWKFAHKIDAQWWSFNGIQGYSFVLPGYRQKDISKIICYFRVIVSLIALALGNKFYYIPAIFGKITPTISSIHQPPSPTINFLKLHIFSQKKWSSCSIFLINLYYTFYY